MTSLSNRLKLILDTATDVVNVSDLAFNFSQLDSFGAPNAICTSAARPTAPNLFAGMMIYETNTGIFRQWDGLALRWMQVGDKALLSTDARPSAPLLGDTIFETDTGIRRIWNGTRFRPSGTGNEYVLQTTALGASISIVGINPFGGSLTIVTDGLTPYNFKVQFPSLAGTGFGVADYIGVQILDNLNGGGNVSMYTKNASCGTTGTSNSITAPYIDIESFTPVVGSHVYTVNLQRGGNASTDTHVTSAWQQLFKISER